MRTDDVLSKMLLLMVDIELSDSDNRERWGKRALRLEEEVANLPDIERSVISNAYDLCDGEHKSVEELAQENNMTGEELLILQGEVLRKLSKALAD